MVEVPLKKAILGNGPLCLGSEALGFDLDRLQGYLAHKKPPPSRGPP